MKIKQIYEELNNLAKDLDIKIRKENGRFRSGWCVVNENKLIIVNKATPAETIAVIIARCIAAHDDIDNLFIKPAVREFIENEKANLRPDKQFSLEVKY